MVPRTVSPAQYLGVPVTETRDETVTWLTQEAYDRLKAELDHLSGPGRIDIAKKIEAARDEGDLKENGGYHAAKDEQGQIEARIILLQHILENARVGAPPRTDGVVGPGMTVTIRFVKDDEEVTFLLASREESGSPIDVYSPRSPLGAAIMGKKAGERATYSLPNGRASTVEILEAVPYAGRGGARPIAPRRRARWSAAGRRWRRRRPRRATRRSAGRTSGRCWPRPCPSAPRCSARSARPSA